MMLFRTLFVLKGDSSQEELNQHGLDKQRDQYTNSEDSIYEKSLSTIGFGRFHYFLLIVCGLANASDAIEILCVSFILPSAECDLKMTTSDKGFLSSMTFVGKKCYFSKIYVLLSSKTYLLG